jgi:ATP-dependent Lhr-like helicase
MEAAMRYEDFPILLETWRTCIRDEFDMDGLKQVLMELERGSISWTEVHTPHPSPFAQGDWWRQVNQYMYMDDSPKADKRSRLRESLLREVVFTPGLRPTVSRKIVEQFELKRQRLSPGYSPQTARELLEWAVERVVIPKDEWEKLLGAIQRDHGVDPEAILDPIKDRLARVRPEEGESHLIAAQEMLSQIRSMYGSVIHALLPFHSEAALAEGGGGGEGDGVPLPPKTETAESDIDAPEETTALLSQWLQFYGPVTKSFIQMTLVMEKNRLQLALEDLIDSQKVIQGQLVTDGGPDEICDSENFEILLRQARVEAIPSFEPLEIEWLPLFIADHQEITKPRDGKEGLLRCLEQLICYPADAELWESEIFPARLHPYDPSWLDSLMQEGNLLWMGSEGYDITFCFEQDLDLLQEGDSAAMSLRGTPHLMRGTEPISQGVGAEEVSASDTDLLSSLFRDKAARYNFSTLLRVSQRSESEIAGRLWEEVWQGRVTNDTFIALRRAIMNRFETERMVAENAKRLRSRVSRRRRLSLVEEKESQSFVGNWHWVPIPELPDDLLETEERRKDRVRLLLDRYGVLFRELLQKEWPVLRWSTVFKALRIMELSGEVLSGIFFHGIPGPQFISQKAFHRLRQRLPEDAIYWMNATDPASLCGLQIDSLRGMLPPRVSGTHLVYRGKDLKVISKRNGKDSSFFVSHDDPDLPKYFISLQHLLTRKFKPLKRITLETINGERAPESPYVPAFRTSFDLSVDPNEVVLFRKTK